jgi:MFS family permease
VTLSAAQAERRFVLLSGLQWLPVGLVAPVLVLLLRARGFDLPVIGTMFALYSAVVIVLELPTGGVADVLGRRRTLLVSRLLSVCGLALMAVAADIAVIAVAIVVLATSRALQSGPLEAWYVDAVHAADPEAEVQRGISRGWAVEAVGLAIGAITGGFLPQLFSGLPQNGLLVPFSVPFILASLLTLAGLLAVIALMPEPPRVGARPSVGRLVRDVPATVAAGLRLAGRDRTIVLVLGATLAFGFALSALEIVAPVQFAHLLGSEESASAVFGVLVTLAFLGSAGGSAVAPRSAGLVGSASRTAALATGLIALFFLGLAVGPPFVAVAVLYVGIYLLAGISGPLGNDLLHLRVNADQRATLLSVRSLIQQLGGLAGSLLIPALAAVSFGLGWLVAGGLVFAGAALLLILPRQVPRIAAAPVTASEVEPAAPAPG